MKKFLAYSGCLLALVSCNIYAPFQGSLGEQGILEEALKCLHKGDVDCAIAQYSKLKNETLKNKKLCLAYMQKAGMGLTQLVNTTQKSTGMLKSLTEELMPWDATKQEAADNAYTACAAYNTAVDGGDDDKTGALLIALGAYVQCATLLAKTEVVNQDDAGTCDNDPTRPADNILEPDDISTTGTGDISGGEGMCDDDANTCRLNLTTISTELSDAGLGNFDNVPASVGTAGTAIFARQAFIDDVASGFQEAEEDR